MMMAGVAALVAVGCSSGSDSAGEPITEESLVARLEEVGGEVVADTSVSLNIEANQLSAGGLVVDLPVGDLAAEFAAEEAFFEAADSAVPPSWPMFELPQRLLTFGDGVAPLLTVAVFKQQAVVADDELRTALLEDLFRLRDPRQEGKFETVATAQVAGANPERECYVTVRERDTKRNSHEAIVMVVGPGLAASGWLIMPGSEPGEFSQMSEYVDAVCGAAVAEVAALTR